MVVILAAWTSACLESRAQDGLSPGDEKIAIQAILANHCGLCHTLQGRGLALDGGIGPDLTQQGRRRRSPEWLKRQLTNPVSIPDEEVSPGFEGKQKLMPRFNHLSEQELNALVRFLNDLE